LKIAVIGAGAMGCIFGGKLSTGHEVHLIDVNEQLVQQIRKDGVILEEDSGRNVYRPCISADSKDLGEMDLVILFVKSMFSRDALKNNKHLIGANTYLLTLQNGAGHEATLEEFARKSRIIIGTTEDNGLMLAPGHVRRGGRGRVNIGCLVESQDGILANIKTAFDCCGFDTCIHENIRQLIWNKLLMNSSLSATTAVLKCTIGYVGADKSAWAMAQALLAEGCAVAEALGLHPDKEELVKKMEYTTTNSPNGMTSIAADLRSGRKTEVDMITGTVVRTAKEVGVAVPAHEFVFHTIHALEGVTV